MLRIPVKTADPYEAIIGENLLSSCGKLIDEKFHGKRACLITDSKVDSLYGKQTENSLRLAGIDYVKYVFPEGEKSKNLSVYSDILEFLAENKITRSDYIIALGGGVTGDMAGFAAATYLRGIKYVGIPTTFLAAVDSSVGGKTAVNLGHGKNLVGAFHQPSMVICDTNTLNTLEPEVFSDGSSETVKYGMITDEKLFTMMNGDFKKNIIEIIGRCIEIKAEIVEGDVFDKGQRQLLNFGHTVGHGIELLSNFTISHGHAVSMGMVIVTGASEAQGIAEKGTCKRLINLLKACDLPVNCTYSAKEIADAASGDKKRMGNRLTLVVPEKVGKCVLYEIKADSLCEFIEKGM